MSEYVRKAILGEAIASTKALDAVAVIVTGAEDNPDPKLAFVRLAGFGVRVTYLDPHSRMKACEGNVVTATSEGLTVSLDEASLEHQEDSTGEITISWEALGIVEIF